MKVLLTGGAGRIAQWILPHLSPELEFVLADRKGQFIDGREIHALDITDYDATLAAMQGMDAVVHLAIASEREVVTDSARFYANEGDEYLRFNELSIDVNLRGTYHVFEAARFAGIKRVIYGSSIAIILGKPAYPHFSEGLPPRPATFYAVTKLWGEQLGEYFARVHGLKIYCLRFGNPYPQNTAAKIAHWKKTTPGQRRSVTFVDLAGAIEAGLRVQDGPAFGAYNIVSACEDSNVDCSAAAEIGWRSRTFCETDGRITPLP
jgi:nucleoside-diphosphate-sugar epimerase